MGTEVRKLLDEAQLQPGSHDIRPVSAMAS
jgi:hypothetical protein